MRREASSGIFTAKAIAHKGKNDHQTSDLLDQEIVEQWHCTL